MGAFFLPLALGTPPSELVTAHPLSVVGFAPVFCLPAAPAGFWSSFPWRRKPPNTISLFAAPSGQRGALPCLEPQEQPLHSGDNVWFLPFGGENLSSALSFWGSGDDGIFPGEVSLCGGLEKKLVLC